MTQKPTLTTKTTTDDRMAFLRAELDVFIGPYEFNENRTGGDFFVVDVRSSESYSKGHLPGAHNIPRKTLGDRMDDVPKDKTVVLYCSDITCFSSKKAAFALFESGYDEVRVLYGGFDAWKRKGYDVETGVGDGQEVAAPPGTN